MSEPALIGAFPAAVRSDAEVALGVLPGAELPVRFWDPPVVLGGGTVRLPSRIDNPEPAPLVLEGLTPQRRIFLHCLYARHHDGFVRQRHAVAVLASREFFAVPFVVQLASDYVFEIVETVRLGLPDIGTYPSRQFLTYGRFLYDNPAAFELVRQRIQSFYSEHYRRAVPREDYPAFELLAAFDRAVAHEANKPRKGARRPRHT